jgi:hypothetical protein
LFDDRCYSAGRRAGAAELEALALHGVRLTEVTVDVYSARQDQLAACINELIHRARTVVVLEDSDNASVAHGNRRSQHAAFGDYRPASHQ